MTVKSTVPRQAPAPGNGPFTVFFPEPTAATGLLVIGKSIEPEEGATQAQE